MYKAQEIVDARRVYILAGALYFSGWHSSGHFSSSPFSRDSSDLEAQLSALGPVTVAGVVCRGTCVLLAPSFAGGMAVPQLQNRNQTEKHRPRSCLHLTGGPLTTGVQP